MSQSGQLGEEWLVSTWPRRGRMNQPVKRDRVPKGSYSDCLLVPCTVCE